MTSWRGASFLTISCLLMNLITGGTSEALANRSSVVKPPLRGLLFMGDITFHRTDNGVPDNSLRQIEAVPAGIFSGVVINVTWAELQPQPDTLDTSEIDKSIAEVISYNKLHSNSQLGIKLRIWPGPNAPSWIKTTAGAPIVIYPQGRPPVQVGAFWSPPYRKAWSALQHALAKRYDSNPLIREVSNSSCSALTDEPFILEGSPQSIHDMLAAGFTDDAFLACLIQSSKDYSGWRTTPTDFAISPYRLIGSGHPVSAPHFMDQIISAFFSARGSRAVFSNHALSSPERPQIVPIIDYITKRQLALEFQMAAMPDDVSQWQAAISYGASLGARAIELWGEHGQFQGFDAMPDNDLTRWSKLLDGQ